MSTCIFKEHEAKSPHDYKNGAERAYMDQALVTDLKQFITTVVVEHTTSLRNDIRLDIRQEVRRLDDKIDKLEEKFENKIDGVEARLENKIDNLSAAVAEALDDSHEATEARLKDHETRLTRLEHKTA